MLKTFPALGLLVVAALTPACGADSNPSPLGTASTLSVTSTTPASGSTLTPPGTPPGAFFVRGSGQFGVTVMITSGYDQPFAQLAVFLLTSGNSDGYCGQNLPDWPAWRPFARGTLTYTVTGFQVFSLPCEVTGIRAVFNTWDVMNRGGFPPASNIIADTTLPVVYHLVQGQ